jgi:prepilin-type processing-associated H-X9-DG protein
MGRPSSPHPGGFLVTYCDGHTAFMSQDIAYQIYAALMTPRGSQARPPGSGPYAAGSNPSTALQTWQMVPVSAESLSQ